MTAVGLVAATAFCVALLLWVVYLIRQDRLYAGYGVIFVVGTVAVMALLDVPPLLRALTAVSEALLPVPSLTLIALVGLTLLVVYIFIQISVLSNRVMRLTQELAIRNPDRSDIETGQPGR